VRPLLFGVAIAVAMSLAAPARAQEAQRSAGTPENDAARGGRSEDDADDVSPTAPRDDNELTRGVYERRRTAFVLERAGLDLYDGDPEGKRIASIQIEREEVFVEGEGPVSWFTWANIFHWLTKKSVIRRELLFEEGDPYREARIEETMRNLRSLGIFAYVRIVPIKAEDEDEVGVLVYTRDLWSLRIENDFQITGGVVNRLLVQLTERNLFGRQKAATARFFLFPDVYWVGQRYVDRRLGGGRWSLTQQGDLIFNRGSNDLEGGSAELTLRRPLFNLAQRFGFIVGGRFFTQIERQLQNGRIRTYDIPETEDEEAIPRLWRERSIVAEAMLRYRRGQGKGHRRTFGVGWETREFTAEPHAQTGLAADQRPAFERDVLPVSRRQIGPVFLYRLFTPTFHVFENLGTFSQSENVRSGPEVQLRLRFPLEAFGSSSDSLVFEGLWGYTLVAGRSITSAELRGGARLEDGEVVNQRLRAELKGALPPWRFLRLVWRVRWAGRRRDTTRTQVALGGDNGLRGFVSQAFATTGGNLFLGNVELRIGSVELWSLHLGAVLFYDVGTAYERRSEIEVHHGVGIGIRFLIPQFNRTPFALDLGAPVREGDGFEVVPSFRGDQVVPLSITEEAIERNDEPTLFLDPAPARSRTFR
jgi:hypothetical protein